MTDKILSTKEIIQARLKGRYNSEKRFKSFGIGMVIVAIIACLVLLVSIFIQASPSFTESRLKIDVNLDAAKIDPLGQRQTADIRAQGDFNGVIVDALVKQFPNAETDGSIDDLMDMVANIAANPLAIYVSKHPDLVGKTIKADLALNDDVDMFLKGGFGKLERTNVSNITATQLPDGSYQFVSAQKGFGSVKTQIVGLISQTFAQKKNLLAIKQAKLKTLQEAKDKTPEQNVEISQIESDATELENFVNNFGAAMGSNSDLSLSDSVPSVILLGGNGAFKATLLNEGKIDTRTLVTPNAPIKDIKIVVVNSSEDTRPLGDRAAALGLLMKDSGLVKTRPNITLLTRSDSNDAEMSGVLSAIIGSLFTLAVTFFIAVPVGVMAAIYLEEFAPKNWLTDLIEVNINNLAAVPSIVFGLLGFSVFLHFFQMPRSAPIVGGIVLSLMCLPVVIIASRAALKAVPPSIREAALGVGASKVQAVFHHVLPLALPGIMTGSILAMAHALGETAPLLMIGMVAFIADIPKGLTDAATVLPVEVYMWAGRPERAWDARTSSAIIVLLVFMLMMNAVAIFLRRKFERRW